MLKTKKLLLSLLLIVFTLSIFLQPWTAQAAFSWPSPTSAFNMVMGTNPGPRILDQIMGDMGVDKNEAKTTIQQMNVQRQKQNPPQVSLSFFPTNPSPGEEVTVTATPTYFASEAKNFYFTWYIKHDGGNRDLNDDGRTNIEDYKIEAARLIANGGYDWDPDGNGAPDGPIYATDTDADGYDAAIGGEDQQGKGTPHCYIHDWPSGNDFELPNCEHLFPDTHGKGDVGDGEYDLNEEKFWRTDPRNDDTRGARQKDEATVAGLGMFEFKFNYQDGDKVGVAVEGASYQPTNYDDSTYKVFWALVKNECPVGSYLPNEDLTDGSTTDNSTDVTTAVGTINMPAPTCTSFTYNDWGDCQPNDLQYRTVAAETPDGCTGGSPVLSQSCSYVGGPDTCTSFTYDASWGACQPDDTQSRGIVTADPPGCAGGSPVLTNSCTYTPDPPAGLDVSDDVLIADGVDPSEWPDFGYLQIGTEIIRYSNLSTAVAGGGLQFSNLQRGVNGTPIAFHADNATITGYTTTVDTEVIEDTNFNAASNTFLVTTTTNTTTTVTDVRGQIFSGPTTVNDSEQDTVENTDSFSMPVSRINDCLEHNMVSPAEGNSLEKLKINLFYTPTAPMNSPLGIDSDYLMLSAGLENAQNEDYLIYDWKIYGFADNPNTDIWTLMPKAALPESTQTHGVGLKTFKFKLQFSKDQIPSVKYIKAKLTITEKRPDQDTNVVQGNASVIIPITPMANRIGIYSAEAYSDSPAPKVNLAGSARCANGVQSAVCPVVKDEIVGLRIDTPTGSGAGLQDIVWTVNGQIVKYTECFFSACNEDKHTDTMFVPILKDIGSIYTINVTAIDSDGEKLNLTKTLQVVEPVMRIVSNEQGIGSTGARAVYLGNYVQLDPASVPTAGAAALEDFSDTDFQSLSGSQANFSLEFNIPANRFTDTGKTNWFLDGKDAATVAGAAVGSGTLSFPVDKTIGESYAVTANAIYRQDPLIQQMLNYYWGVRIDQIYEKQLTHKIDLSVVNILNGVGANTEKTLPKKILAALTSGASSYLIFLLRIVLTTGLLLFFIRLVLSLVPKNYET